MRISPITTAAMLMLSLPVVATPVGAQTETVLHSFTGADGAIPYLTAPLVGIDGNIYGVTQHGGPVGKNAGVLYEYNTSTLQYSVLHYFEDGSVPQDGGVPFGPLAQDAFGNIYGTTSQGGPNLSGTLYEYTPSSKKYQILLDFSYSNGSIPTGLNIGSDGNLYGATEEGGNGDGGTVFEYNLTTQTETVLHNFGDGSVTNDNGYDGNSPEAPPIMASDGNLYGTTYDGGSGGCGVLYEYDISTETTSILYNFGSTTNGGEFLYTGVVQAKDGNLYGTTSGGGTDSNGTLFEYNLTSQSLSYLHNFGSQSNDGLGPYGTLMQAVDGNLYGTTYVGGDNFGEIYEYNFAAKSVIDVYNFGTSSPNDGVQPMGGVAQDANGIFWGTTTAGGGPVYDGALYSFNNNAPPALASATVTPHSVTGGNGATLTIALTSAAGPSGVTVNLSTINGTGAVGLPSTVTITNASSVQVPVSTSPVASDQLVSLVAKYNGVTKSCHLTVLAPVLTALAVSPSKVVGGTSTTGTVTLSGIAAVDTTVDVTAEFEVASAVHPLTVVGGPVAPIGPVVVPAGDSSASFTVDTTPVAATTPVTISATLGSTINKTLTVTAPSVTSVTFSPRTISGTHQNTTLTVTISSPAPSGGLPISMSYTDGSELVNAPSTITVPAGATSASITTRAAVDASASVTATGTVGTTSKSGSLTINP